MIEERCRVEDRMLRLAQKARLRHTAKDEWRRGFAVGRIEAMARKLNRLIGDAAAVQRGEQGLKPLRVLVEDCKFGSRLRFDGQVHRGGHLGSGWAQVHQLGVVLNAESRE